MTLFRNLTDDPDLTLGTIFELHLSSLRQRETFHTIACLKEVVLSRTVLMTMDPNAVCPTEITNVCVCTLFFFIREPVVFRNGENAKEY